MRCISLVETSLSPEPALRKISRRPLIGAVFVAGACTRKKTCGGGEDRRAWLWSWMKATATLATISKRRSKLQFLRMSMHDLNAANLRENQSRSSKLRA